ncbi:MAG TPA: hypothetical protein VKE69_00325, partial [Planctomycetota bacterium]|nr:hypothetical protein [Planctomycetota bacterium]
MIRLARPFVVLAAFVAALARGGAQDAPAAQPASQPASQPATQPASAPASSDPFSARTRDREAIRLAVAPPGLERGDYDAAASAILDRIAADADKLGFAEALLARASALMERAADRAALEERAAKLLSNEKIPGLARYRLEHFRAATALRAGDEAALLRGGDFFPGNVTSFACIGPLGDAFPDVLSVTFEPEKGLSLGASVPGLGGVECTWKTITRRPFEPYVDLAPLGGPPQGARYAKAQMRSSSARGAYLLLGAPSSHAVWWNGEEVARADWAVEPRGFRGPIPIVVRQGWNEALVKLEGGTTVSLRVVDEKGRALAGLEESSELIDRAVPPLLEPTPKPRAYADSASKLSTWLAAQTGDVDAHALRGFVESATDRASEALVDLREAVAAAPDRPELGVLLAETLLTAPHLPPSEAKNRAREAIDRVLAKSPAYVPALLLRADLLARDDRMEEALATLDEAEKAAPQCFL